MGLLETVWNVIRDMMTPGCKHFKTGIETILDLQNATAIAIQFEFISTGFSTAFHGKMSLARRYPKVSESSC